MFLPSTRPAARDIEVTNPIKGAVALQFGRTKILRDETEITAENVVRVLSETALVHRTNSLDMHTLYQYYKGDQPILDRVKEIRPEICNTIVENRANEIVAFKTGYLCGEPLQYVSRASRAADSEGIGKLNDMMMLCGKPALDKELAEWMYVCGTGYRMIMPNKDYIKRSIIPRLLNRIFAFYEDESPYNVYTLDPRYSYVVYHSGLGEPPIMGVKYIQKLDKTIVFSVYTPSQYFEIINNVVVKTEPRTLGEIPIIEYPLNNARQGVFEIVMPILDAINTVQSNRLDGIEQFVQSLILLYNCDIDDDAAKSIREAGLIKLRSVGENKADLKILAEQLDQTQTQALIDYMYQTVLNIVGMPNRNGGTSTSDTGSAVVMRDGWEAAEARAKSDELMFKEAERKFLKIALQIVRATVGTSLKLADIETKFTRRNYENALSKSQVLTSMLANPKIHPLLAFEHCGMFADPQSAYEMSKAHYEEYKSEEERKAAALNKPVGDGNAGGGDAVA